MMDIKKRIERFNLDRFLEVINSSIEEVKGTESPDFLCHYDRKSLGIEMTSFKNKHLSEICEIQKKIVQSAKKNSRRRSASS